MNSPSKVTADHLRRSAYLYVRQSTLRQVHENCESTARQYDLKRRAQALGLSRFREFGQRDEWKDCSSASH
jgi:DNA invertase Pin-like site-specific DNA recombinase